MKGKWSIMKGIGKRMSAPLAGLCLATIIGGHALAKTTLTIAMWRNDVPTATATQKMLDEYAKTNNVKIKFIYVGYNDYIDKLLTLTTAGQMPDVVVLDRRMLPRFAQNRLVRPLDDVVASEKLDLKKTLTETKSGIYAKKFYGFPIWGGPALQYYNPDLFAKAGVPDPNDLIKDGKWNWNGLLEYGRKLTKDANGDGKPEIFALEGISAWQADWVSKVRQNGGEVVSDDYKKARINEPAAVEGLSFWADLSLRYNIAPKVGQTGTFETGKSAMRYGWVSESVTWKEAYKKRKIDMQITMMPAGKEGFVHIAGGCPVCVSNSTKNFKEAYKLAKWFALDSQEWRNTGVPARKSTYEGEYQQYLSKYFGHPEMTRRAMENSDPEPVIHPRYQLMENAFNDILWPVQQGRLSAAAAADKLAARLNVILSGK